MGNRESGAEPRWLAAQACLAVLDRGQALDAVLSDLLAPIASSRDRSLGRRLVHAVLRDWPALNHMLGQLIERAPRRKDRPAWFVLAVGLAELREAREPAPAVVHAAVEAIRLARLGRLTGMVNGVLRQFIRRRAELEAALPDEPAIRHGYPGWLVRQIRADWPEDWSDILDQGNRPPPLWLRVNQRHWSRDQALETLLSAGYQAETVAGLPDALRLARRAAVSALPGFAEGGLSVQDGAAQLVVEYLDLDDGLRVLDACAAPGGKAAHILERAAVDLTAIDIEAHRLGDVEHNLQRLGLKARLVQADAAASTDWWDGRPFDRILIDAPCSATGVIRRHPDIRWLRREADIETLVATQARLLDNLWPLLAPGGILVYATCSVLAAENVLQAQSFMERHDALQVLEHDGLPGRPQHPGRQILPGEMDLDGFYHLAVRRLHSEGGD
jgi:16S rRNA (cytosine967-C5)-methyltransferase